MHSVEEEGLQLEKAGPPGVLSFLYVFVPLHKEGSPVSGGTTYLGALFFTQYFKGIVLGLQRHGCTSAACCIFCSYLKTVWQRETLISLKACISLLKTPHAPILTPCCSLAPQY